MGDWTYKLYLFLTSALGGDDVVSFTHRPLYPRVNSPDPHWKCLHFVVVVGLEWPKDPKSYAGGSLLLVGSPLPDKSKVMAQTKRGTLVLQVGGWVAG
jgi:hypothetical protein